MELFMKASKLSLRFETSRGHLSTEDLWDLPLVSTVNRTNLNTIAQGLNRILKDDTNVSFVETATIADPNHTQLKFDIVKAIIDFKLAENKKRDAAKARSDMRQKVMEVIASKQDDALKNKSLDELQAMLAEEDAAA